METIYSEAFFKNRQAAIFQSALRIAPWVRKQLDPFEDAFAGSRIIDVGCGCGEWLMVLEAMGANRPLGVDGAWVPRHMRCCTDFAELNLESAIPLCGNYDLVICLELAEHLSPERTDPLVLALAGADRILWSAAVPGQGGTGHLNEQPHAYWIDRFAEHGYEARSLNQWADDPLVAGWYRQNLFWLVRP